MRSLDAAQDRMGGTRVDADDIVNQLMEGHDFIQNASAEGKINEIYLGEEKNS